MVVRSRWRWRHPSSAGRNGKGAWACAVLGLAVLVQTGPAPVAVAETIDPAREYRACLILARAKPAEGFERAQAWEGLGGGEAARHCAAAALVGLKDYRAAAARLQDLAETSRRENSLRAGMLAQAGQAWLLAGEVDKAYAAQTTALLLAPKDANIYIDRSQTLAEARNYWEAIDDLNSALDLAPDRVDALVFRAAAYRYVDAADLARQDIDRALRLAPASPEALLERGMLHRLAGRTAEARKDWLRVLAIDPTTPTADATRRNLELLDNRDARPD